MMQFSEPNHVQPLLNGSKLQMTRIPGKREISGNVKDIFNEQAIILKNSDIIGLSLKENNE